MGLQWDKPSTKWCRISSIHSMSWFCLVPNCGQNIWSRWFNHTFGQKWRIQFWPDGLCHYIVLCFRDNIFIQSRSVFRDKNCPQVWNHQSVQELVRVFVVFSLWTQKQRKVSCCELVFLLGTPKNHHQISGTKPGISMEVEHGGGIWDLHDCSGNT